MSAILRWFHDGDVRYWAYFRTSQATPARRELIIASREGQAADVIADDRELEDFTSAELLAYANRLRGEQSATSPISVGDAAAD